MSSGTNRILGVTTDIDRSHWGSEKKTRKIAVMACSVLNLLRVSNEKGGHDGIAMARISTLRGASQIFSRADQLILGWESNVFHHFTPSMETTRMSVGVFDALNGLVT